MFGLLATAAFAQVGPSGASGAASRIRVALAAPSPTSVAVPSAGPLRAALDAVYAAREFHPVWFDRERQLTASGRQVLDALAGAGEWGLRSEDYRADELRAQVARAARDDSPSAVPRPEASSTTDPGASAASAAWGARRAQTGTAVRDDIVVAADVGLSVAVVRLLGHVARGRVDPATLDIDLPASSKELPLAEWLDIASRGQLREAIERAEPTAPSYQRLKAALAETRRLLDLPAPPPLAIDGKLSPGDVHDAVPNLIVRLRRLGDLDQAPLDANQYAGPVVEAVKRFQSRHGLETDGVVGFATLAELLVPPQERVVKLELALERARWLTRIPAGRVVVVNVAAFEAQAFERLHEADPVLSTRVVVGEAEKTPTPLFGGVLETVVFRPYWYPPRSILANEILPALARDPDYLVKNDFEIVAREGDGAEALAATEERIVDVAAGALRLRQRPGAKNALGTVKFLFPNRHSVYMHDTPARALFPRARRDFSHGCIRVASPLELAEFVLQGSRGWDPNRIREAAAARDTVNVAVGSDVQVVVFYATADVASDGRPRFFPDIYSLDPQLLARLAWLDR